MELYRISSSKGTFLINPEHRVFDEDLVGKDVRFYADKENIDKWLLISLLNAREQYNDIPFNRLHKELGYYIETYYYKGDKELEAIESSTYNCNSKKEYKIHNSDIEYISRKDIDDIPDWDSVFPSEFKGGK